MNGMERFAIKQMIDRYESEQKRHDASAEESREQRRAILKSDDTSEGLNDGFTLADLANVTDEIAWDRGSQSVYGKVVRELKELLEAAE